MKKYTVVAFYQFTSLTDCEAMKAPLIKIMKEKDIKGTIIIAHEGINGSFCGEKEAVSFLMNYLHSYSALKDLVFRETFDDNNPFAKAKVKLRKEIVTLGKEHVNPSQQTGIHVPPNEWNALIANPDVMVIDTRNEYEVMLGTFDGAVSPETDNFRDFPQYVENNLLDKKDKKIAMFCTGGIRCEKSTAYLKQLGFNEVYQLDGGILNYLSVIPEEDSKWKGSCFVFDERVALDSQLNSLEAGSIDKEWKNNNKIMADGN